MDSLLRYGEGTKEYTFVADNQINLANNFGDVVTQTVRMPGMSGGFNQYGNEPPPSEVGSINYSFWLYYNTPAEGVTARDNLFKMADWGLQKLFMLPQNDSGQDERWTYAIVNNIHANFNSQNLNQKRMLVSMTFHVPDPFWMSATETEVEFYPTAATTYTFTVGGSVRTQPRIALFSAQSGITIGSAGINLPNLKVLIGGTAGSSIVNPKIVRIESGVETHRMNYTGTLSTSGEYLVLECREQTCKETGVNTWGNLTRTRAEMLMLSPGSNSIKIEGTVTNALRLNIRYYEMWR